MGGMDVADANRVVFPVAVGLFLFVGLVVPIVRLRVRAGVWAVTSLRSKQAPEIVLHVVLAGSLAGLAVWAVLHAVLGAEALGVWRLPSYLTVVGWLLAFGGIVGIVVAQAQMGVSWRIGIEEEEQTALVTRGVYRYVRNPIYSALFVVLAGACLASPSGWSITACLLAGGGIWVQTRREERHMLASHGEAYAAWAREVGRFVPGVGRLRYDGEPEA